MYVYARMYVYVCICMYISIFIYVRISVYARICQYICNWVWNIQTYTYIYIQYVHIRVYIQYTYCTYIAVYFDHIRTYMISNFIYWHILTCRFTDASGSSPQKDILRYPEISWDILRYLLIRIGRKISLDKQKDIHR